MNNLTTQEKFMQVRLETVSPLCCVSRFVLCFSWALFLVALPGRAQTPASAQKTITLEELQRMALQNNPTFRQSAANIQAAEGRKKQSGIYPKPTVGYQGEQIRGGAVHRGGDGFFRPPDKRARRKTRPERQNFDPEPPEGVT